MKVSITVKTNSKHEKVEAQPDGRGLKVFVNAPPIDGKANEALCRLLAEHFKVPKRSVRIISGQRAKKKTVEIL